MTAPTFPYSQATDEIIKVFRTSTSLTKDVSVQLAETLKMATEFSIHVDHFREQTLKDLHHQSSKLC
jgi:hypothetical protein